MPDFKGLINARRRKAAAESSKTSQWSQQATSTTPLTFRGVTHNLVADDVEAGPAGDAGGGEIRHGENTSQAAVNTNPSLATSKGLQIKSDGFTVLPIQDPTCDVNLDICFVHGLNGDAAKTWTHPTTGFFWPLQLARDISHARVMLFGYDTLIQPAVGSNNIRLLGVATALLQHLINKRSGEAEIHRPLLFIGHSLGGLVIKKCMIEAARVPKVGREAVYRSTTSVFFMGTPNAGSLITKASRVRLLELVAKASFTKVPPRIRRLLKLHSDELLDLAGHFRELEVCRRNALLIYSFHETLNFPGLGQRVVDEHSARVNASEEVELPIIADHRNMVRYTDVSDGNYCLVKDTLEVVHTRFTRKRPSAASAIVSQTMSSSETVLRLAQLQPGFAQPETDLWTAGRAEAATTNRRHYEVPTGRKIKDFIGRSDLLSRLNQSFYNLLQGVNNRPQIVTLVGMGGIGKTQVALKYCEETFHRRELSFRHVLWLNASSAESLTTHFAKLSITLVSKRKGFGDITERATQVLAELETWKTPYLLVFDNYDDPSFTSVLDYVPKTSPCGILFTTRLREAAEAFGEMIEVPLMSDPDALGMLYSRLHLSRSEAEHLSDAKDVVGLLGNLPLALEQAGAYMVAGGARMSFATFKAHFNRRKKSILERTPKFWKYTSLCHGDDRARNLNVLTTWELSLDKLGSSPVDHQRKVHFLTLLAFLDSKRISRILFESHAKYLDDCPTCSQRPSWMTIFGPDAGGFDEALFRDVLIEMANLSLIRQLVEDDSGHYLALSLHPLVQDWAQFRISVKQQEQMVMEASYVIFDLLVANRGLANVPNIERMLPARSSSDQWTHAVHVSEMLAECLAHMDICVSNWKRWNIRSTTTTATPGHILHVEYIFGEVWASCLWFDKAFEMYERAHQTVAHCFGKDHHFSLLLRSSLCAIRVGQGRGSEVQAELEALIKLADANGLGEGGNMLLLCWLMLLFLDQGEPCSAETLAKTLSASFDKFAIEDDVEASMLITSLVSSTLSRAGLRDDATRVCRRTIDLHQSYFDQDLATPHLLEAFLELKIGLMKHVLLLFEATGSYEFLLEAEALLQALRKDTSKNVSLRLRFHERAIQGQLYAARGFWAQAVEQTESAYLYYVKAVGSAHPLSSGTLCDLIKQLLQKDSLDIVRPCRFIEEAVSEAEHTFGESSEQVLRLERALASSLHNAGYYRLALSLHSDRRERLCKVSFNTKAMLSQVDMELATTLLLISDRKDVETQRAEELYQNIIKADVTQGLPMVTERNFRARINLASLYRDMSRSSEAIALYDEALKIHSRLPNKDIHDLWLVHQCKAACLRTLGDPAAALSILHTLHHTQTLERRLPTDDIAKTLIQIGHCYSDMLSDEEPRAHEKAEIYYRKVMVIRQQETQEGISEDIAYVHRWLGELYLKKADYSRAGDEYQMALTWTQQKGGEQCFKDSLKLGRISLLQSSFEKARFEFETCLATARKTYGGESKEVWWVEDLLAVVLVKLGDVEASLTYREEQLKLLEIIEGIDIDDILQSLQNTANCCWLVGRFELARSALLKFLERRVPTDGLDNAATTPILAELALLEHHLGNLTTSLQYSRRVLDLEARLGSEANLAVRNAEAASSHCWLGLGDLDQAETHGERCVNISSNMEGEGHISTMRALYHLATIKFKQGDYGRVAELLKQCLPEIRQADQISQFWTSYWLSRIASGEEMLAVCESKLGQSPTIERWRIATQNVLDE